ncbi:exonuclease VII, large subunit [uncultured Woeseiaceae bacterium]|uniref:Exodeoxyribonuclease 7 large subunit n=1 Tax=uncultured Woeseiaceae bacterium TaxID=1983305 RepID=A0A7D9H8R1_9GAMM|nr:exonuclease VII, large subunit [uncultured Woeseiaceae bacterium]
MDDLLSISPAQSAISVSELNRQVKTLLEQGLARLWVEGEISNLARPASGHLYFSLKDESSQIRCAWFRQRQRGPTINLKNGDQVLAFGRVSIYEARGDYQLIVEQLEEAGEGELRRRYEALKKKLSDEGLFDEGVKQDLPELPERIGVVTSPSGAAVRDIITVLKRRFPSIPIVIYPSLVQGETAAELISEAIATAVSRNECDVLIVARGGGSLDDLWSFNEEIVARAIHDCPIPIVSAVGHEVDFTIADFVADVRAPTPSGAAELVVPDQAEWLRSLSATAARIALLGRRYLEEKFQTVDWLSRRLTQGSPAAIVARQSDWLRNLQQILTGAIRHDLASRARNVENIRFRLLQRSPAISVQQSMQRLSTLQQRLSGSGTSAVDRLNVRLGLAARALDSVSPLATLDRGYAIVSDEETGAILTDAAKIKPGSGIRAQLARGTLQATVNKADTGSSHDS